MSLFTGQRRGEFIEFLRSRLDAVAGASAADELESAAIRPSKQLLTLAAAEIRDREQFVLLDEQQVAYPMVMRAVERSRRQREGGPDRHRRAGVREERDRAEPAG